MKRTQNLEKSDKWIVGLTALCALLLFSWLMYDIAFYNPLLEGQTPIGKIYEAQNRVKRKFNRSLIWYAAESNETVYENDWIFTGSQSIAKIRLDSGGEIIIEPDSLIILSRKNGVLQLDLQHGRLMADVKSKDVQINIVKNGSTEKVDTSQGVIRIAQDDGPKDKPLIEDLKLDEDADGKDDETLSDLADRKYYKPEPGYSEMKVNGLSLSEKDQFDFKLLKGQKATVSLDWQDPFEKWKNYEAQVTLDPSFEKLVSQKTDSKLQIDFQVSESQNLFWRVRGFDENGEPSRWTEAQPVRVKIEFMQKSKPVRLARKKLLYRLNKSELEKVKPNRTYDIDKKKPVKIEWEQDQQAAAYRVEISDKEDFSNIIEQKIVKDNQLDLKNINLGKTFFRVTPETKDGVAMAEEAVGEVQTYFPAPSADSLKTVDKKEFQVLRWDAVPYAQGYQVTYKTDKNSDKETVKYVTDNKLRVENKTGYLQWKVRVIDPETKKHMSTNSKTVDWYNAAKRLASLHGTGQAGLLYPKITRPEPRKTFISVNNSPLFIVMSWEYGKNVPAYEVEVSKTPEMNDLVYKKRVDRQRAVINQSFRPGIYFIRVRAVAEDVTQETWSEVEVFRVINRKAR